MKKIDSFASLLFLSFTFLLVVSFLSTYGCDGPRVKRRDRDVGRQSLDNGDEIVEIEEEDFDVVPGTSDFELGIAPGTSDFEMIEEIIPGATEDTMIGIAEIFEEPEKPTTKPVPAPEKKTEPTPQPEPAPQPEVAPQTTAQFPAIVGVPKIFANLPEDLHNPDGLTVSDDQQTIFMCCPNFNGRPNDEGKKLHGAFLVSFDLQGNFEKLLEFPILEETGQFGAMGLDFGPDGHLYVCDNQYFFKKDHKSRIVRVIMDGKKPTGEIQIVATGLKLANAILWMEDKMLVSDTFLDLEGKYGAGGIWMFTKDEALKAGTTDNPPITVQPNGTDPRLVVIEESEKIGRGDNAGADGMTCTPDGIVYFGNFGDGAMYRVEFDANNKPTCEKIHKAGEVFTCCDGIFYDKRTDKVYINDSEKNAIRAFKPVKAGEKPTFELIWENDDTDGSNGLLDQPCECVVIGDRMIICNFDWTFPGLKNTKFDAPYTMSEIQLK